VNSATRFRAAVESGDLDAARELLGEKVARAGLATTLA
jgi:hypothetical protein